MTETELERMFAALRHQAAFNDVVFVMVVERSQKGIRLLEYGLKEIGDLAAWIAVQNQQSFHQGEIQ